MQSDDPYLHEYFRRFRATGDAGDGRSILFLVGSAGISGGTYVILQHADYLVDQGWDVTLGVRMGDVGAGNWHPALDRVNVIPLDAAGEREYTIAIASWWPTVYNLPSIRARHFAYLVQSVESRFYGANLEEQWAQPLAELTYTFGIPVITIATWLQVYLAMRHGAPSFLVPNGIRKDLYTPFGPTIAPREPGKLRVLVEGPSHVHLKNVDAAFRLARAGGADEIWHLTGQGSGIAEADRVFEQVAVEAVPAIYRSCDVIVKLSRVEGMFGPPLEMFHCGGTAVTYDVTGHEEYLNQSNSIVVPTDDEHGVVDAIRKLKTEPEELARLKIGALNTASHWPDWALSSALFHRVVSAMARQPEKDLTMTKLAIRGAAQDLG